MLNVAGVSRLHPRAQGGAPAAPEPALAHARRILAIQAAVLNAPGFAAGAEAAAVALRAALGADRVCLGWLERRAIEPAGASAAPERAVRADDARELAAAMHEALDQGLAIWDADAEGFPPPTACIAHLALARSTGCSVLTVPMRVRGRGVAALTLERRRVSWKREEIDLLQDAADALAGILALRRRERGWTRIRLAQLLGVGGEAGAGVGRVSKRVLVVGLLCGAALIPVPFHLGAPARLEPAAPATVAAPYDATLAAMRVVPGQAVKAGDVVAEIVPAQGGAPVPLFAPSDGVVAAVAAAPVRGEAIPRGLGLADIVPARRHRVVVEVDERDISAVRAGQSGSLTLSGLGPTALPIRVESLAPVAAERGGRTVFEVRAALAADAPGTMLAGMRGMALIEIERRKPVAVWAGRAWTWLRLRLWSLGLPA